MHIIADQNEIGVVDSRPHPFLKWAGGKRWLTANFEELFPNRNTINNYIEPFLGGGAVFFYIQPSIGILSDLNADLINAYIVIRDQWQYLLENLHDHDRQHETSYYYSIRASIPTSPVEKAARFIYLNRTCWNGLYRVNKKGQFNVPIGTKSRVIYDTDDFKRLSEIFADMTLTVCDFEQSIDRAVCGDFVFIDPPYTVKHNLNGFVKYNETIFSWNDQIRLKDAVVRAKNRGAMILVSNANHQSIVDLYNGVGELVVVNRSSIIAGKSSARGESTELAIKCW